MAFIWLGTMETPPCPEDTDADREVGNESVYHSAHDDVCEEQEKRMCAYRGPRRGGCLGLWRLRMEEGGRRDAGCRGICRLHKAEEALGNEKRLPPHHRTDAGE